METVARRAVRGHKLLSQQDKTLDSYIKFFIQIISKIDKINYGKRMPRAEHYWKNCENSPSPRQELPSLAKEWLFIMSMMPSPEGEKIKERKWCSWGKANNFSHQVLQSLYIFPEKESGSGQRFPPLYPTSLFFVGGVVCVCEMGDQGG